jgi:TRAP-type C4-dicarboxylate transport system permease small subunit
MLEKLDKLGAFLNGVLTFLAILLLGWMVLITSANIILRVFWKPIGGTVEMMAYSSALVAAFALGYTQKEKANISVDLLFEKYPVWLRRFFSCVNCLFVGTFFCLVGWQLTRYATTLRTAGEVSETLGIIYYPFTYGVALGCFVLAFIVLLEMLKAVMNAKENS